MSMSDALRAVKAAEEVCRVAIDKLEEVIGFKSVRDQDVTREQRLLTRARRRKTHFTTLRHELEAAGTVVRAPSPAEIQTVENLIARVRAISIQAAAGAAGLQLAQEVKTALDQINATNRGIKAA